MADQTATLGIAFETTGVDKVKRDLQDVTRESKSAAQQVSQAGTEIRQKLGVNDQWSASERRVHDELVKQNIMLKLNKEQRAALTAEMRLGANASASAIQEIRLLAVENFRLQQAARAASAELNGLGFAGLNARTSIQAMRGAIIGSAGALGGFGNAAGAVRAGVAGLVTALSVGLVIAMEAAGDAATVAANRLRGLLGKGVGDAAFKGLETGAAAAGKSVSGLAGDVEAAVRAFEALRQASGGPKFVFPDTEAGRQAAVQFGRSLTNLVPMIKALKDLMAGDGLGFEKQSEVIRKFFNEAEKNGGRVTGEMIRTLREAAPSAAAAILEILKPFRNKQDIEALLKDLNQFPATLDQISRSAGKLQGAALAPPPTVRGAWDELKDSISALFETIQKQTGLNPIRDLFNLVTDAVKSLTTALRNFTLPDWLKALPGALKEIAGIPLGGIASVFDAIKLGAVAAKSAVEELIAVLSRLGTAGAVENKALDDAPSAQSDMTFNRGRLQRGDQQGIDVQSTGEAIDKLQRLERELQALAPPAQQAADAAAAVASPLGSAATALDQTTQAAQPAADGLGQVGTSMGDLGSAALSAAAQMEQAAARIQAAAAAAASSGGEDISFDIGANLHGGFYRVPGSGAVPISGSVHGGEIIAVIPAGGAGKTGTVAIPPSMQQGGASSAPYAFSVTTPPVTSGSGGELISFSGVQTFGLPIAPGQREKIAARRAAEAQAQADNNTASRIVTESEGRVPGYWPSGKASPGLSRPPGTVGGSSSWLGRNQGIQLGGGRGDQSIAGAFGRGGGGMGAGGVGGYLDDYLGPRSRGGGGRGRIDDPMYVEGSGRPPSEPPGPSRIVGNTFYQDEGYTGAPYADTGGGEISGSQMGGYYDQGYYDSGMDYGYDTGYYDTGMDYGYDQGYYDYYGDPVMDYYFDNQDAINSGYNDAFNYYDNGGYYDTGYSDSGMDYGYDTGYYDPGYSGDFAEGGSFSVRGRGGRDTNRVSMGLTSGEMVTVSPPGRNVLEIGGGGMGAGGGEYHFHFYGDAGRRLVNDSGSRLAMRRFVQRSLNG